MADRDVFTPLGPGYASAARQLATGLPMDAVVKGICQALLRRLNEAGGVPATLFDALCHVLTRLRREWREVPLLACSPEKQYQFRQEARDICRQHGGYALRDVADTAVMRLMVTERGRPQGGKGQVREALARAVVHELFEHDFAGKVEGLLREHGLTAAEARRRAQECRSEFKACDAVSELVEKMAKQPEASQRRLRALHVRRQATAQTLHQPLGDLLSSPAEVRP
jgi:hypothetical protein